MFYGMDSISEAARLVGGVTDYAAESAAYERDKMASTEAAALTPKFNQRAAKFLSWQDPEQYAKDPALQRLYAISGQSPASWQLPQYETGRSGVSSKTKTVLIVGVVLLAGYFLFKKS